VTVPESVTKELPPLPDKERSALEQQINKLLRPSIATLDDFYTSNFIPNIEPSKQSVTSTATATKAKPAPKATAASSKTSSGSSTPTSSSSIATTDAASTEEGVRYAFLLFFVSLLRNYRDNLIYLRVFPEPMAIFNRRQLLRSRPESKVCCYDLPLGINLTIYMQDWLELFLDTQIFGSFLTKHSWPSENIFDDFIDKKTYRKPLEDILQALPKHHVTETTHAQRPDRKASDSTSNISNSDWLYYQLLIYDFFYHRETGVCEFPFDWQRGSSHCQPDT
jgi:hypothetical protein